MKKFTLSLAFALLFGFAANAQNQPKLTPAQDAQVAEQTRELAQKIGLNEREYITLRQLNQERFVQTNEVERMYSNDHEMRELKLREIDEHFDARLQAVMNPKQQEAYAAYKEASEMPTNIAGADEDDDRSAEERARDRR
jgi:hypothetical protein